MVDQTVFYAYEKLSHTVDLLATSHKPLWERIIDAYVDQGNRTPAIEGGEDDMTLRADISQWHDDMTFREGVAGEGKVEVTAGSWSDVEASSMADRIVSLWHRVESVYWRERGAS